MKTMLCGGNPANLFDLGAVPLPPATLTHHPVAHDVFAKMVTSKIESHGLAVRKETYLLNKDGAQMVGAIECDAADDESSISFALRSSHDKSMSKGLACGRNIFVCSNGMFEADGFKVLRRHTLNIWDDLESLIEGVIASTEQAQESFGRKIELMRQIELTTEQGYEVLGRALGQKALTPTQATTAFREWRTPQYADFQPRNFWSLYNAGTEALKLGPVRNTIKRHTNWDRQVTRTFRSMKVRRKMIEKMIAMAEQVKGERR